jgi:hypothetical protein
LPATIGYGGILNWNGQSVAGLNSVGGFEISTDLVEATTLLSSNAFKEYIAGLNDTSEIPVAGDFIASDTNGQLAMITDASARTSRTLSVTFPTITGASFTATALITKIKVGDVTPAGKIGFTASLKMMGAPTWATAASAGMSALTISNSAVLSPTFAIGTFDYAATVLTGISSVTFTPTAANHTITITANGLSQNVVSGQASTAVSLGAAGSITDVKITVQEANKASKTYTVRMVRP